MNYFYKRKKLCYNTLEFTVSEIIMKKKCVAGLILLLPLGLLAACGGGGPTTLSISPNWYANTTTSLTSYSKEELTYDVTFQPPQVEGDCTVTYETGTYKTTLETVSYDFKDGSSGRVYLYTTRLDISGQYTYKGTAGETFTDFVASEVYFHTTERNVLVPIESKKEIVSTSPVQNPGDDMFFSKVHYKYDVVYNTADAPNETLQSAEITTTRIYRNEEDKEEEAAETETVKIKSKGSFFDNEEVLFAMRGLDMSAAAKFYTIDLRTYDVTGVTFSGAPEKTVFTPAKDNPLTVDGTAVAGDIQAYTLHFYYDSDHSGPARTAVYAAKLDDSRNNTYRNVLLQLEDPIPYGYGTFYYTLRSATFAK